MIHYYDCIAFNVVVVVVVFVGAMLAANSKVAKGNEKKTKEQ